MSVFGKSVDYGCARKARRRIRCALSLCSRDLPLPSLQMHVAAGDGPPRLQQGGEEEDHYFSLFKPSVLLFFLLLSRCVGRATKEQVRRKEFSLLVRGLVFSSLPSSSPAESRLHSAEFGCREHGIRQRINVLN